MSTKAKVFAIHKAETFNSRYHEVIWAANGNLNTAAKRGYIRRFVEWSDAKSFAAKKARELNTKAIYS
jgi:hypothetical protein